MALSTTPTPGIAAAVQRTSAELRTLLAELHASAGANAETLMAIEAVGRLADAARIRAAAAFGNDPLTTERLGFASPTAAVSSLARVSERTARARLAVGRLVTPDTSISGAPLPPAFPLLAESLDTGEVGIDAAVLVARELGSVVTRVPADVLSAAERVMVNLASSHDPAGERVVPPVSVDYLSTEIRRVGATIDPDGALPREQRAMRKRGFRLGAQDDDGLVPASGRLLPEVAGLLQGMLEAARRSPRFVEAVEDAESVESLGDRDSRTPDQRRHDALAEILMAAAAAEGAPQLDGRPVTVLVTVDADELQRPDGLDGDPIGTMAGSRFPVSRVQVERFIDAGGYREIYMTRKGRVVGISSPERCFTGIQRLGIVARDGAECGRPGCTTAHFALQVHHVVPVRDGGPTTIDNGILLCYWDHQRVDDGPWDYRMVDGLPEVRGPGVPEWVPMRPRRARAA